MRDMQDDTVHLVLNFFLYVVCQSFFIFIEHIACIENGNIVSMKE